MKNSIMLVGALTAALISSANAATIQKVTFTFMGTYAGTLTSATNTAKGVTTVTSSASSVNFKITDADVLATYGKTTANAYLAVTNLPDSSKQIVLVSGNATPIPVLNVESTEFSAGKSTSTQKTNSSSYSDSGTTYIAADTALPTDVVWGGTTNKNTIGAAIVSATLHAAGTSSFSDSSSTSKGTNTVSTSTGTVTLTVLGPVTVVPPHAITASATPVQGVITSGTLKVTKVPVK